MALTTTFSLSVKALLTGATDVAQTVSPHLLNFAVSWASGTGANQADVVWGDERTIAASGTDDLDLAGSLVGALGTVTFAKVKLIVVTANAGNTNTVVVGGAASAQFVGPFGAATHTASAAAGGFVAFGNPSSAGWSVTATTADLLRIANGGAGSGVTYKILIIGTSA